MSRYKNIRRENLKLLLKTECNNKQADMIEFTGKSQSTISQYLAGKKSIGDDVANQFEDIFKKKEGWLDQDHGEDRIAEPDNVYQLSKYRERIIEIPIFTAPFAMGSGIVENLDHHVIVSNLKITRKFIRENVSVQTTPDNLRIVTGLGDSMTPTFNDGDQLFLDTGVTEVEVDAIYAFEYKAQFYIKRLQRMPGGLIEAHSDSNNYNTFKIEKKHRDSFNIYGRIVGIWNFRKI